MSSFFHDEGPRATGQKVCLATVAYDSPDASYTFSIQRSREALRMAGIQSAYMLLSGNCHVDDARNNVVQNFLLTDCTDLVFLDADVSWQPESLVELCQYDRDLVGAVYPYRHTGNGDKMPVRMVESTMQEEDGLVEVEGLPTGFMRIRRNVLEQLAANASSYWNRGDRRSQTPILFERTFENEIRWGGDLAFCNKWRAAGGKIYTAPEIRLGHTGKTIIYDSFGAWIRRHRNETLRHATERLRKGSSSIELVTEARDYVGNHGYVPLADVLMLSVLTARKATGPIIEAGSGLTTILMAAATDQTVYCLEHDPVWAARLEKMAIEAGVRVSLCLAPLRDGWYDLEPFHDLPERFAVGLNDGPPRDLGRRMDFFERLGNRCDNIVVDDVDERAYADEVERWALDNARSIQFVDDRGALIRGPDDARQEHVA